MKVHDFKVYTAYMNEALINQVIYALVVRKREIGSRPDYDSEAIAHTNAALELMLELKEGKKA